MSRTYLAAEHRRAQIDAAALALSAGGGLYDWSIGDVADMVGISREGVRRYYTSTQALREHVVRSAVEANDVDIVTQALAKYDPLVADIAPTLRKACARHIIR